MNKEDFTNSILNIDKKLNLKIFKSTFPWLWWNKNTTIKIHSGNHSNFSVDNTTAFNRAIDGNTKGTSQSGYIDYENKKIHRIKPISKKDILNIHKTSNSIKLFNDNQMKEIINSILDHQSSKSSIETYNNRAKLIMHNFDVFRYNAN